MEHYYTAYTKMINNTSYYFIKKYTRFSELKDAPAILENYAMHTNFIKACKIACIDDAVIMQQLFNEANPGNCYADNTAKPALSTNLRVELINNKPSLVSRLSGIKKLISARIPHWRILSHS